MIVNGRFVNTGNKTLVGFKADGTAVHGPGNFSIRYNDGSKNVTINHVNKHRGNNDSSVFYIPRLWYLYKINCSRSRSSINSKWTLQVGSQVTATVKEIRTNATNTHLILVKW